MMNQRVSPLRTAGFLLLLSSVILSGGLSAAVEPPGPSTRKTSFIFSEIMHTPAGVNPDTLEFIEIYNSNPFYEDLGGYQVTGVVNYTFPAGTGIPANGYLVLARDPSALQAAYDLTGVTVVAVSGTALPKKGLLELRNNAGGIILQTEYSSDSPWPIGADGAGHSLVLARPSYGEAQAEAWGLSNVVGGSPGGEDPSTADPLGVVVINEILSHTDDPQLDSIELYNHSNQSVDLSGCGLSDSAATVKFTIPPGTVIPARGFMVFDQNQVGFSLSAEGEEVYFWNPANTRVLDAVQFGAQSNGISVGRFPDGGPEFYRMANVTPGASNTAIRQEDVIINEVMYDPISGNSDQEYVELLNRTASNIDLGGWRLEGGVSYTIPANTLVPAGGYLVLAKDTAELQAKYPQLNSTNLRGNFSGSLKNRGERIALSKPDTTTSTDGSGNVTLTTIHIVVDEVTYRSGGQWPVWAKGGGSSIERIDPRSNGRLAASWKDSDETQKAPWTTIEFTGVMDNGRTSAVSVEGGLLDRGECLLDDVEVNVGGSNLVTNPGFESGYGTWVARGSHERSSVDAGVGVGGSAALHVRATSRCDYGANRLYAPLSSAPANGTTVTIRARARWQRGWPELLLRLHGNYLEATGAMAVPENPGTPGQVNSASAANTSPAIHSVSHSPVLPASGQPVVVTAQAQDPDGVAAMQVIYRIDPGTSNQSLTMNDAGTAGDAVAGDGIYSATIPGQATNTMVAFRISAADASASNLQAAFPANAPANGPRTLECLVRFGEPVNNSSFGTYRQWFTSAAISAWTNRPAISNESVEGTFVYGDYRVIYDFRSAYAGSPSHQSWASPTSDCHYTMDMPLDDMLLGTDNFNKIHAPGNNPFSDGSLQREQSTYWIARQLGLPWSYRRYVNMYVNGSLRKTNFLMEDVQVPGSDLIEQYFPDDADGNLYKINGWWEMDDATSLALPNSTRVWATLGQYYSPSGTKNHKLARYRWMWQPRATNQTANDFQSILRLADTVNMADDDAFANTIEQDADVDQWLRTWAVRKTVGDWDFYGGSSSGQNGYLYYPQNGRAKWFIWDVNTIIGLNLSNAPGAGMLPTANWTWQDAAVLNRFYTYPKFRRYYLQALQQIANDALAASKIGPVLDAKYNAFIADGLAVMSPDATFSYTDNRTKDNGTSVSFSGSIRSWFAEARTGLLARVAENDTGSFTINGATTINTANNTVTLTGKAPIDARTILINGVAYPIKWTSTTAWSVIVPVPAGTTNLDFTATDIHGDALPAYDRSITVTSTAPATEPEGVVVFSEILYHPALAGAAFVEIQNRSTTTTFDLSGWRINGLSYVFPAGSIIQPGQYLVLAKDRVDFANQYGEATLVFDTFGGNLDPDGETLTLLRPGATSGAEITVDRVRYETAAPWPAVVAGQSLQVIDSSRDNSRASNWTTASAAAGNPQWVFASVTGVPQTTTSSRPLYVYLESAGDIYIDDVRLVAGSTPAVGTNLVPNGDFEGTLSPWEIGSNNNNSGSTISTAIKHSGSSSLHLVATSGGTTKASSIWQDFTTSLTTGTTYTLSFWYRQTSSGGPLTLRFSGNGITTTVNPTPTVVPAASPGSASPLAAALPEYPTLWLNEVQADNISGPMDNQGEKDPWIEIHNSGTSEINLTGYFLSDDYDSLGKWAFPTDAVVPSGGFLRVWCDNQTAQTVTGHLHAGFRLSSGTGHVALSRNLSGVAQLVDYLNYTSLAPNRSYGDVPDGQPFARQSMFYVSPGASNNGAAAPAAIFINEWLADNSATIADPADGKYEDWFELYNAGDTDVDLGGYYLTDTLTNKTKFIVPNNGHYVVPAHGYLLVWADNGSAQNSLLLSDLHAEFALSKGGEALGLYAPDGTTAIDTVTFGAQATDISQGRYPDGSALIRTFATTSPRATNAIPNTAPVLAAIGDTTVYTGTIVSFTATATDAESAFQTLVYSLVTPPSGATIQSATGAFSWTPAMSIAPAVYPVTIKVTDNGTPALSDSKTFSITVLAPPEAPKIITTSVSGAMFTLGFETIDGLSYQVQYSETMNEDSWLPLGDSIPGDGMVASVNTDISGVDKCFYRIIVEY